mgnify:CR=1 FL=1|tara:strand:- start:2728 stop:3054 length:327 start_codon:yes stop_codon:yes gene_type:complete
MTKAATKRSAGAYSVQGKKAKILQTKDKHKLWNDLFEVTEAQISDLKRKVTEGESLDDKDMRKLDGCFNGLKRLLEIENQLKSDAIAAMTDDELIKLARKTIRERKND